MTGNLNLLVSGKFQQQLESYESITDTFRGKVKSVNGFPDLFYNQNRSIYPKQLPNMVKCHQNVVVGAAAEKKIFLHLLL